MELKKYCTVINMNWDGEVMHGAFDGTYYVLEDGDGYTPEDILGYEVTFMDENPIPPNAKAVGLDAAGGQSHTSDGLCPGADNGERS